MRRAVREGRRASPPVRVVLETGVELDSQPGSKPGRVEFLRVRSLRTQQRAESQCQVVTPCRGSSGSWWGFLWLIDIESVQFSVLSLDQIIYGEFDPGSGRTLAACLTHASRTVNPLRWGISGERVSNTWATCPRLWDNSKKLGLIPDMTADRMVWWWKDLSAGDGPAAYQLVGGVVAYQGDDG